MPQKLKTKKYISATEYADFYGVARDTVYRWYKAGLLTGHFFNAHTKVWFDPNEKPPKKWKRIE